jgi:hypothetical protein
MHISFSVHEADVKKVADEICACIPGRFNPVSKTFEELRDPQLDLLQRYVLKKQLHRCEDGACLNDKHYCKYGFPWKPHPGPFAEFYSEKMGWVYFRPRYEDCNVVPYHPLILLLWGAHVNIQRVTSDAWSHYLLKYAMKCDPAGTLKIDADAARALGLHGCSNIELKAVFAYCLSKPVSPCEATKNLLEFPLLERSGTVVDSSCWILIWFIRPNCLTRVN